MTGRAWHSARETWANLRILLLCHREAHRRVDEPVTLTEHPARAWPPKTPMPAPGHHPPHHDTGGTEYTIRAYRCGCIHLWDGDGRLTGVTPCSADLDEELRRLTP